MKPPPRGCTHLSDAWCAGCHARTLKDAVERASALEAIIRRVGKWLKSAHHQRSVAYKAFSGQPMELAKLEAQMHLLAQAHLILSGQLHVVNNRRKKGP